MKGNLSAAEILLKRARNAEEVDLYLRSNMFLSIWQAKIRSLQDCSNEAEVMLRSLCSQAKAKKYWDLYVKAMIALGHSLVERDEYDEAATHFQAALKAADQTERADLDIEAKTGHALCLLKLGQQKNAGYLIIKAMTRAQQGGLGLLRANAMVAYADILVSRDQEEEAVRILQHASKEAQSCGYMITCAQIQKRLKQLHVLPDKPSNERIRTDRLGTDRENP